MTVPENPIFILSKVFFQYPDTTSWILKDYSIRFPRSSITAILGINGSGKSTLLKLLLGALKPEKGSIIFSDNARKKHNGLIAFLPQVEYLAFDYSVEEYILLGRVPHVDFWGTPSLDDLSKVQKIINELNLKKIRNNKITHLSGGEFQKVRLGRALVQEPTVLLLDEPTTHLDLNSKKNILDLLSSLKKKGVTVILTSHDPTEASLIADYFVMMRKGNLPIYGAPEDVFTAINLSKTYNMKLNVISLHEKKIVING